MIRPHPENYTGTTLANLHGIPFYAAAVPIHFRKYCRFFFTAIAFLLSSSTLTAQQPHDYAIHANIVYRFTKYVDWPDDTRYGDFIIGVVGESPIYDALRETMVGKNVGDQRIVIRRFTAGAASFSCHMLFIGEDERNSVKKIAARTAGESVLLITEGEGLASKGACINFIIESERLKLEINKTNIISRNLDIASELLKLGKIVK
jgi:hypothetical protein